MTTAHRTDTREAEEGQDVGQWIRVQDLRWFDERVTCLVIDDQRFFFVRSSDRSLRGYTAKCPHRARVLTAEDVHDAVVTCPLHGWHFDLASEGREIHGYANLPAVPLRIIDGTVYIRPQGT